MFNDNLKRIMQEKGYNVTKLSQSSGIGKSSISMYLSGKNIPLPGRIQVLADALDCDVADLAEVPVNVPSKQVIGTETNEVFNVSVETAAKLMHKKNNFVYEGLRQGIFPWGYAVQTSKQWSYYISSAKFTECTGIKVQLEG